MTRITHVEPEQATPESRALLDRCDEAVTALRADRSDRGAIDAVFRAMHTLKGNARIFQITTVQDLAHDVEDDVQRIRDGEGELSEASVDAVQEAVTKVRALLDELVVQELQLTRAQTGVGVRGHALRQRDGF